MRAFAVLIRNASEVLTCDGPLRGPAEATLAPIPGGAVGIGYSLHAGQVIVADGTDAAAKRISRVLTSDPGMGVLRHADAGYEEAVTCAKERGVKIPGLTA